MGFICLCNFYTTRWYWIASFESCSLRLYKEHIPVSLKFFADTFNGCVVFQYVNLSPFIKLECRSFGTIWYAYCVLRILCCTAKRHTCSSSGTNRVSARHCPGCPEFALSSSVELQEVEWLGLTEHLKSLVRTAFQKCYTGSPFCFYYIKKEF